MSTTTDSSVSELVKSRVRIVPDFPKKGVVFYDIFPIFMDPDIVETIVCHIVDHVGYLFGVIDLVVGLEARGFLLGPMIALRLGAAFAPVRKAGKLPGDTVQVGYTKEYGTDSFEMQTSAVESGQRVLVIDDSIATGGSAKAAQQLVTKMGGTVVEFIFIAELTAFRGHEQLDAPVYSIVQF